MGDGLAFCSVLCGAAAGRDTGTSATVACVGFGAARPQPDRNRQSAMINTDVVFILFMLEHPDVIKLNGPIESQFLT